jgi:hypothetical protein
VDTVIPEPTTPERQSDTEPRGGVLTGVLTEALRRAHQRAAQQDSGSYRCRPDHHTAP